VAPEGVAGFGDGGYGVQLQVQQTTSTVLALGFAAPLRIHIAAQSGPFAPLYSTNGVTYKPVLPLVEGALPSGALVGYLRQSDGSVEFRTTIAGYFALLPDETRPRAPATLDARFSHGSLLLRWPKSTDNSGEVTGYRVTLTNRPLLAVTGATAAAVTTFHRAVPSVYRVVAIDAAGNESVPSKPIVVLPTKRPSKIPKAIPAWAFALYDWKRQGKQGARPDAPRIVPAWYWQWSVWRAGPFHIRGA
jgi:hypothetical protein